MPLVEYLLNIQRTVKLYRYCENSIPIWLINGRSPERSATKEQIAFPDASSRAGARQRSMIK
jgi:hypothetical protein